MISKNTENNSNDKTTTTATTTVTTTTKKNWQQQQLSCYATLFSAAVYRFNYGSPIAGWSLWVFLKNPFWKQSANSNDMTFMGHNGFGKRDLSKAFRALLVSYHPKKLGVFPLCTSGFLLASSSWNHSLSANTLHSKVSKAFLGIRNGACSIESMGESTWFLYLIATTWLSSALLCTFLAFIDIAFDNPSTALLESGGSAELCVMATLRPDLESFTRDQIENGVEPAFAVNITAVGTFSPPLSGNMPLEHFAHMHPYFGG